MDQLYSVRPREKLQSRGAGFLTNSELIQVLFGSGSSTMPVARIARTIEPHLKQGVLTFELLTAIPGVGNAKACQLLAAVELGRRLANQTTPLQGEAHDVQSLFQLVRTKPVGVTCQWFNGAQQLLGVRSYPLSKRGSVTALVQQIFSDTLASAGRSVVVAITIGKRASTPSPTDLQLLATLKGAAQLLQVRIIEVWAVGAHEQVSWKGEI